MPDQHVPTAPSSPENDPRRAPDATGAGSASPAASGAGNGPQTPAQPAVSAGDAPRTAVDGPCGASPALDGSQGDTGRDRAPGGQQEAADLAARLDALKARMARPQPSPEQIAAWDAEDQALIPRIRAVMPGVPAHHVLAVLQALRAIRWGDEPEPVSGAPTGNACRLCGHDRGPNRVLCRPCAWGEGAPDA